MTIDNKTLDRNGGLTEQQESILRGIFREKRKWGRRVFPPVKTGLPNSSQDYPRTICLRGTRMGLESKIGYCAH